MAAGEATGARDGTARRLDLLAAIRDLPAIRGAALAAGGIAFLLYIRTMLPGVAVGDWAEMQYVPARLDVPHPTGYPLYTLLGWVFSLLPIGSHAFRAGLLSVVAASGAVAVTVLIAGRLGVRPLIAGIAGLTLAVSGTLWLEAVYPEMNGLHLLLMALIVHRLLVWQQERRDRDLLLGALLCGLALSNHLLAVTAVPLVAIYVLLTAWRELLARPLLLPGMALAGAAGLALYLFIPLRALMGPPEIYAELATWDGFWALVKGETFERDMHFWDGESLAAAWRAVPDIVAQLVERSHGIFVAAGVVGVVAVRDGRLRLLFVALALVNVYFYVNYLGDLHHYLLLTWMVLALGGAVLAERVIAWADARTNGGSRGVEVLLVLLPLVVVVAQQPLADQSRNRTGELLAAQIFDALPRDAVLLTYWDTLTMLSYKHCMEGVRPDVTLRAFDTTSRATCDGAAGPLESEIRRGRPAFALFALEAEVDRIPEWFELTPGPSFELPYGQRFLEHTGTLYRVTLRPDAPPTPP